MRAKWHCRRICVCVLDIAGAALVFASWLAALYYWDPTRMLFKRAVATDPYLYEAVEPRFRDQDPAAFIGVRDGAALREVRSKVVEVIWGRDGLPDSGLPDEVIRDLDKRRDSGDKCPSGPFEPLLKTLRCEVRNYATWDNLAGIDELRIFVRSESVESAFPASVAYFRPLRANGTLVIYQHGFAGTYHAQHRYLEHLVAAGFTVAATSLANYGDNNCPEREQTPWCAVSAGVFDVPLPMRVHFTPLVKTINFALGEGSVRHVAMIGFSAGAWITAVMAAVDTRIARSYPVAGVIPFYLRRDKEWSPAQSYPPLINAAGMLDLYVLGASGAGRRQVQYFNRFDRCCYNGTRPLLYEKAVETAVREWGGGAFDVVIDETHARHKISRWTFERILGDLGASLGSQ
ncbi:alpha/beta fold hydrolase [Shumkonia mesophila]|uniref:alpha/beta fold hydrolase n=1 Tax=Shumkonia mesophila TaxID=2838854 RepID=UPI00374306D4